jgi:hypothetical protein
LPRQFRNTNAIKRELSSTYYALKGGEITPEQAHRRAYVLNILAKVCEQLWRENQLFDLAARMDALEKGTK